MNQREQVLDLIQKNPGCTSAFLIKETGLPRGHVSKMVERIQKIHELDIRKVGGKNTYKYICRSDQKEEIVAQAELRERAIALLRAMLRINFSQIEMALGVSTPEAIRLMAFLVEGGYATIEENWTIVQR